MNDIVRVIFGDNISITDFLGTVVLILTPVITAFYNKARNKTFLTMKQSDYKDAQIAQLKSEVNSMKEGFSALANIMATAYLSSNTISPETKKVIAAYAQELDKLAAVDITAGTKKLIEAVGEVLPDLNEKKEEILEVTKQVENVIDEVNEKTQSAIDNIQL